MDASTAGRVIWITGLSGSGKTTVSLLLKAELERGGERTLLLDGDALRALMPQGGRFDRQSRLELALSYGKLCQLIAAQGISVICATISMRREVYAWNRANLPGYVEVYLDVAAALRAARDPKRLYQRHSQGDLKEMAGRDQEVDYPSAPHIHLKPGAGDTPEATCAEILKGLAALRRP
jgi:cytidine diphosphoramidate kinase